MKKPGPLTILAPLSLPLLLLMLPVRSAQIKEVLVAAHVENSAVAFWPGMGTHDLVGVALPMFQMVTLSVLFLQASRRHSHLRKLAAATWGALFTAELLAFWALPQWGPEAPVRFAVTLGVMFATDFGGALVLEHFVCPVCCTIAASLQKFCR